MSEAGTTSNQRKEFPPRLFASGRYSKGRLNIYSKPDILSFVKKILEGSEEWVKIRTSQSGSLFNLPVAQCPISCQLIHGLLSRQLVTKKKYELWTVFGGHPLRFSLTEFGNITDLNCGEIPYSFHKDKKKTLFEVVEGSVWDRYIGSDPKATLADVAHMLEDSEGMAIERKFGLALILT